MTKKDISYRHILNLKHILTLLYFSLKMILSEFMQSIKISIRVISQSYTRYYEKQEVDWPLY